MALLNSVYRLDAWPIFPLHCSVKSHAKVKHLLAHVYFAAVSKSHNGLIVLKNSEFQML